MKRVRGNYDLKRLQRTQVEILDEVVSICEEYKINYFFVGGTLLGAVRHKGFIPWDDDIDIAMPRIDYNRFLKIAKEKLSDQYFIRNNEVDCMYHLVFTKVVKKNTIFKERAVNGFADTKRNGISIDIFPLDVASGINRIQDFKKWLLTQVWVLFLIKLAKDNRPVGFVDNFRLFLANIMPAKLLQFIREFVMTTHLPGGKYFVNLGSQYNPQKQTMHMSVYLPTKKLEFEGKYYSVPRDYEFWLTRIFGPRYMQLPPLEKRITHAALEICFDTNNENVIIIAEE